VKLSIKPGALGQSVCLSGWYLLHTSDLGSHTHRHTCTDAYSNTDTPHVRHSTSSQPRSRASVAWIQAPSTLTLLSTQTMYNGNATHHSTQISTTHIKTLFYIPSPHYDFKFKAVQESWAIAKMTVRCDAPYIWVPWKFSGVS